MLFRSPQTFKAIDPNSLDQKDYKIYFNNYFEQLDKLKKIEALKKYVTFLSEIWEHFDGSGLPNGFKDNKVPKISQIINLSLSYHIGVYKIYDNETSSHKMNTEFFQTPEKTIQRHANTVHIIFKNSSWYDFDVIDTFNNILKIKIFRNSLIDKNIIKVTYHNNDIRVVKYSTDEYHYDEIIKNVIRIEKKLDEAT